MQPSSDFCAAQEALQNARADASTLDNVRGQAMAAAAAWAKEGALALKREERKLRDAPAGATEANGFSENPDRGAAEAAPAMSAA